MPSAASRQHANPAADLLANLSALERRALWLATWTIHHANHVRPSRDGLKVGGHQASCASAVTILTALFGHALRPQDRIAVKPHAAPVFHALMYLLDQQQRAALENFRALGGAQSYPSRTKDAAPVDFSTGSVGLGVGVTLFASLAQDILAAQDRLGDAPGRMVAVLGDAELDEGNVFEALLEGWKHDVRNLWWVIDYNRQSLDGVVSDRLFQKIQAFFAAMGWQVVTLKYGKRLQAAFAGPGGAALEHWVDTCPNDLYSALTFEGGAGFRRELERDLRDDPGIAHLLASHDDAALQALMTNLAGHDLAMLVEAFDAAASSEQPHCFVAYTIKGHGLPFAGHKDNHAGLMNPAQMATFQAAQGIPTGAEWEPLAGLDDASAAALRAFMGKIAPRRRAAPRAAATPVPALPVPAGESLSTQEAFGRLMLDLAKSGAPLARQIVTTSPDVTVSTNLGGWVNQVGLYRREPQADVFRDRRLPSAQKWQRHPQGRHLELGIAENNLFLVLAALGLSEPLFGGRLLPVGTVYDPFIARGLDALNYACYQDARFLLVGTPSGVTLAPEGGAHQSIGTPLIAMAQPGLIGYEPAFATDLHAIFTWALDHMQRPDGASVYLRLSTRALEQPATPAPVEAVISGGYWLREPVPGTSLAIIACGALLPEAIEAVARLGARHSGIGLLVVTSPDRLHADWIANPAHARITGLLSPVARDATLISVHDAHPAALSWLGSVRGQRIVPLGVNRFGQSADVPDLYASLGLDADAIVAAAT